MAIEVSIASVLRGAGDTAATFCGISARLIAGTVVVLLDGPVIWLFATLFADYGVKVMILLWKYKSGSWLHNKL
jgi:Na+-driven multidrug efflux pump